MEHKKISIADEQGNAVGSENYLIALEKGLIRMVSRVFVFDAAGKLLIQKRSKNIRHPLLLDQSVGGHVDEGETYLQAAVREMEEEIGLSDTVLTEVVSSYLIGIDSEKCFNTIYKTTVPVGTPIQFDEEEIENIYWMTFEEVAKQVTEHPSDFTNGFIQIWTHLRDKLVA